MALRRLGRYEIVREIAAGGMARVYLGRVVGEGGFERLVALKVMHEHLTRDPEFLAMFLDEARLAARIRHPNVVSTLDIQKLPEGMFLVMEYVDGPALQDIRKQLKSERNRLPIDMTVRVLMDTLAGLHAAHELCDADGSPLQLVHRDVSPHNILVGKDGIARLTDFGVARAEARISSTSSGKLKGKMSYMPPEQIMGHTVDRRSDVYAAAIVLWELLTGKRLFRADSEGELIHKILAGNPPWPQKLNKRVPLAVASVCMRAMARNPDDRYATAEDFGDALENAARSAAVTPAKARAVGGFVQELVPRMEQSPPASTGAATPASLSSELVSKLDLAAVDGFDSVAPPSGPPAGVGSGMTDAGAVLSMAPPRSRRGLIALVAVGCLVIGAGGALLYVRSQAVDGPAPASVAPAASSAPMGAEPRALSSTTTTAPSATASASATSASPASAASASPPAAAPVVRPRPSPAPPRPPAQPEPSPTTFRPSRL